MYQTALLLLSFCCGDTLTFYNDKNKIDFGNHGLPALKHNQALKKNNELKFFESVFDSLGSCYGELSYTTPKEIKTFSDVVNFQKNRFDKRIFFLERRYKSSRITENFYHYAFDFFTYKFYDDVFKNRDKCCLWSLTNLCW